MTTHELQQQQRNKKSNLVCGPRKSPRLNSQQVKNPHVSNSNVNRKSPEVTSHRKSAPLKNQQEVKDASVKKSGTAKRRLDLHDPPCEDEVTDENEIPVRRLLLILS